MWRTRAGGRAAVGVAVSHQDTTVDVSDKAIAEEIERRSLQGILPVLPEERIWGFLDFSLITIGLAIATWVFLIGGTCALFVGTKAGAAAILAGNSVAVMFMALSTTVASNKYGVEQFTLLRTVFGSRGTLFPLAFGELLWIVWTGVLMAMLGRVGLNIVRGLGTVPHDWDTPLTIMFGIAGLLFCWIVLSRGVKMIESLNRFVAPGLALILILIVVLILRELSLDQILALRPIQASQDPWLSYVIAFELNLGAGFGWWPFMGSLARLTRTRRAAFWPNMIGLNLFAVIGTIIGLVAGLKFGTSDPTQWMIPLAGVPIGIGILLFIGFGNITATVSTDYVACLGLQQVKRFERMRWRTLTTVFAVPCAVLVLFPSGIYDRFSSILALTGTLMSPLAGVYLADFFLLRRQRLDMRQVYETSPRGLYYFWSGVNPCAIASVLAGVLIYFLLFNPLSFAAGRVFRLFAASLPAMVVTMIVHYVLVRLIVMPAGRGGYSR
jgi:NCS1 family nucleobase:cation symporter-1